MKEKSIRAVICGQRFGVQHASYLRLAYDTVIKAVGSGAEKIEVVFLVESNEERDELRNKLERTQLENESSFVLDETTYFERIPSILKDSEKP